MRVLCVDAVDDSHTQELDDSVAGSICFFIEIYERSDRRRVAVRRPVRWFDGPRGPLRAYYYYSAAPQTAAASLLHNNSSSDNVA